jgi:ABC-type amino acid transport substrate-binding protein
LASGLFTYLLLFTLVGPTHTETTTRLDAIVGGGTLRVGLTDDYRPFSFADVSGKVEGIDVDMAMSLAQSLGVRLEIIKTSWSALKSDLGRNSFDIAMSQVCSRTVDDQGELPGFGERRSVIHASRPPALERVDQSDRPQRHDQNRYRLSSPFAGRPPRFASSPLRRPPQVSLLSNGL